MSERTQPDGYPRFSADELARRAGLARQVADAAGADALLCFGTAGSDLAVQYLSEWPPTREAHLLFPLRGEPVLWVQFSNHLPNARAVSSLADVRWGGPESAAAVAEEARRRGLRRLGVVGPLPFTQHAALAGAGLELVDVSAAWVRTARLIKSAEEVAWLRRGAELTDLGLAALAREARPGLSEVELGAIVDEAYLRLGGQTYIHYIGATPMADPAVCVPAQRPSSRRLARGDVLFVELSAQYWSYPGQVLRTFTIEAEPTPLYRRLHEVAEAAFAAVRDVLRDGCTAEEVVEAAAGIEAAGFTIYDDLLHGFGGGYLPPVLRTRGALHRPVPEFVFRAGMTVVVQPNVVTPDQRAGVQTGELLLITGSGTESLHRAPPGLRRLG